MKGIRNKEFNYFQSFIETSNIALDAARYLQKVLQSFDPKDVETHTKAMHDIENKADGMKHDTLQHLAHEFMTPIEREDIVALSQQIDNVVDAIEEVMRRIYMFDIKTIRPDTIELAALIVRCCEGLVEAATEFAHFKKSKTILSKIIEVNSIESEGDKLHAERIRSLYTGESDMRTIVVWMTMYECFEDCLDACEDAADIMESVIMKNT